MCDWDIWVVVVKSGFIGAGSCSTLKDHDRATKKIKILRTEHRKMHEQRVYFTSEFAAQRIVLNNFLVVRGGGDEKKRSGEQGDCCCVFVLSRETRRARNWYFAIHVVRTAIGCGV